MCVMINLYYLNMDCVRILLTGCNRGLGRDVLNLLAQKNKDYLVVGTARMGLLISKSRSTNSTQTTKSKYSP